jgi:hypothetical protein
MECFPSISFCLSSPDFVSSIFFLTPSPPQSGQSSLDVVRTEMKEGRACYRLIEKLMVCLSPCSLSSVLGPPHSSSLLLLSETVPVALLPSRSLQSESRPTPRRNPRQKQRPKSESGPQAEFIEEGGGDL